MSEMFDINKIAVGLIARYSSAFVDRITTFSKAQANSIAGFLGVGLTSLVAEQLRQVRYVKTFLSPDRPTEFDDVYVNLQLVTREGVRIRDEDLILKYGKHERSTIVGTAGSGKSMMLKYFVKICSTYSDQVPVLVELRRYNSLSDSDFF